MKTEDIRKFIIENTKADDFSCLIREVDSHETRFAQNGITQHLAGPKMGITLNLSFGKKSGSSSTNQSDEKSLLQLIKTAEDIAMLAPEDPEHIASAKDMKLPKIDNVSQATLDLSPETMVDIVQRSIDKARAMDALVSGMCEKHHHKLCMFTKNGFHGKDEFTIFGHSMTLKKGDVETKVSYDSKDYAGFDLDSLFARLASQAEALSELKSFDAEKIAVILRPAALMELLRYMGWMLNRRQSDEGFTPFTGMLDKQCFGELFNFSSTRTKDEIIAHSFITGWGMPEGIPALETQWVENGVLKNMPVGRYWAEKTGAEPSGIFNMYVQGGDVSEEEMMKMVPRGLIINRFWYIRPVDMKRGELTGMTRDGVLYFEDGEIKHAVNNLRFNEIPHEMTKRFLALGKEELASASAIVPTALIGDFNFVDKTNF